jgi:hypothetical protein
VTEVVDGPGRLTKLLPYAVIAAAICLFASEFMQMFQFTPPGGEAVCAQDAGDRHSNAQMVIAAAAIIGTIAAVYGGSRPAAFSVAAMGVVGLLIFLISDLRVVNTTGALSAACGGESGFLSSAEAVPQGGFYLELVGALALAVTGIALATLTPAQLASLRPGKRARPTDARGSDSSKDTEDSDAPTHKPDDRKGRLSRLTRTKARQRG